MSYIVKSLSSKGYYQHSYSGFHMSGHILLADDSHSVHRQAKMILEENSIPLICVLNGDEAYRHALADPPFLILADLTMPRMGGLELCRKLGVEERTRGIPVVLLVSPFDEFDERMEAQNGARGHLMKPLEADALMKAIAMIAHPEKNIEEPGVNDGTEGEAADVHHEEERAADHGSGEGNAVDASDEGDASDLPEPDGLSHGADLPPLTRLPRLGTREEEIASLPDDAVTESVDVPDAATVFSASPTVIEIASEEVDAWMSPEDTEIPPSVLEDPDRAELANILNDVAEHGTLPALVRSIVQRELDRLLPQAIEKALRAHGVIPPHDDASESETLDTSKEH